MSRIVAGKYRLLRPIGTGGMGEVFEAENVDTHKRVAIKRIRANAGAHGEALDRLHQEARGSALVRHPNVVDVYDLVREGETAYLIMEFLEGEPLSAAIDRGDLPAHRMVGYVLGAMRGVAAVHRQGVIHRDIKPDNIFLAREGDTPQPVPKVLDFGVCKLRANAPGALSLTRSGHMMGTPLYMPLEQLEGRTDIDGRSDVYAFGVTLYQAVTGQLPIKANSITDLIVKISSGDITPPRANKPELPQALEQLILWALEPQRDQRLSSLDAFIDELEPFASEREYGRDSAGPPVLGAARALAGHVPQRRSEPAALATDMRSRRRQLLLGAGLLAVAVVAALGLVAWRARPSEHRALRAPPPPAVVAHDTRRAPAGARPSEALAAPAVPAAASAPAPHMHESHHATPSLPRARERRSARPSAAEKTNAPPAATNAAPADAPVAGAATPRGRPMHAEQF